VCSGELANPCSATAPATSFLKQIEDLKQRTTWDFVYASDGAEILPGKWVFDQKFDENGNWIRNRAR
jgi:hypothetical protein